MVIEQIMIKRIYLDDEEAQQGKFNNCDVKRCCEERGSWMERWKNKLRKLRERVTEGIDY
jgi:hypothetical protein